MSRSINQREIEHFAKDSALWWDENGPFRPLHRLNPLRLRYIRDRLVSHFGRQENDLTPLKNLKVLDIGCGGGLVCEPLARLGADVTGIDADEQAIAVARKHSEKSGLSRVPANASPVCAMPDWAGTVQYKTAAAEDLAAGKEKFDAVLALEIVEHVDNLDDFIQSCTQLCKPGGVLIFSTLNRTPKSFLLGIVAAEYFLRWVPRGTHDWKKFVRPSELAASLRHSGLKPVNMQGMVFNPLKAEFELSGNNVSVNYFITAEKS